MGVAQVSRSAIFFPSCSADETFSSSRLCPAFPPQRRLPSLCVLGRNWDNAHSEAELRTPSGNLRYPELAAGPFKLVSLGAAFLADPLSAQSSSSDHGKRRGRASSSLSRRLAVTGWTIPLLTGAGRGRFDDVGGKGLLPPPPFYPRSLRSPTSSTIPHAFQTPFLQLVFCTALPRSKASSSANEEKAKPRQVGERQEWTSSGSSFRKLIYRDASRSAAKATLRASQEEAAHLARLFPVDHISSLPLLDYNSA